MQHWRAVSLPVLRNYFKRETPRYWSYTKWQVLRTQCFSNPHRSEMNFFGIPDLGFRIRTVVDPNPKSSDSDPETVTGNTSVKKSFLLFWAKILTLRSVSSSDTIDLWILNRLFKKSFGSTTLQIQFFCVKFSYTICWCLLHKCTAYYNFHTKT
jgi:hypothetical protein